MALLTSPSASPTTLTYSIIASLLPTPLNPSHAAHLLLPTKSNICGFSTLQSPTVACLYKLQICSFVESVRGVLDCFIRVEDIVKSYYRISKGIYYYCQWDCQFFCYKPGWFVTVGFGYYFLNRDFQVFLIQFMSVCVCIIQKHPTITYNIYKLCQYMQTQQSNPFTKKPHSNSTPTIKPQPEYTSAPKAPIFRRTDHTDEPTSQATNSHINSNHHNHIRFNPYPQLRERQQGLLSGQFPISYSRSHSNNQLLKEKQKLCHREIEQMENQQLQYDEMLEKEKLVVELRERLRNVQHFYQVRIEEERDKNIERSQIFIGIIQQLQIVHNSKVLTLQQTQNQLQQQQKSVDGFDSRMQGLNTKIQQILTKSQHLKQENQRLETQVQAKKQQNEQKCGKIEQMREQMYAVRGRLEQFEKLRLKENRRERELMDMINGIFYG